MLSGVKFIPRDQLNQEKQHSSVKERKNSSKRKEKQRKKKKKPHYDSSDEEGTEMIEKSSKRRKKWYSSDASSSSSSSSSESDGVNKRENRKRKKDRKASSDDDRDFLSQDNKEIARKEMGLEWMLRPANKQDRRPAETDEPIEEPQEEEVKKPNPRELNPYLKDNGPGYPEEESGTKVGGDQLLSSSVIGDGGASWRLKALKRAKEQAAREGKKLDEVVEERWDSLGQLAVSVASCTVAPARAHLHAIKDRKRGAPDSSKAVADDRTKRGSDKLRGGNREYLRDVSSRHHEMREPKIHDSLSWRKRKGQNMSKEDSLLLSAATSSLNKFADDGSFMHQITRDQNVNAVASVSPSRTIIEEETVESEFVSREECPVSKQALSANQLAAKVLQLRMKGKHQEAEELVKEMEAMTAVQESGAKTSSHGTERSSRYVGGAMLLQQKRKEEDADMNLAQNIIQNKQYRMSGRADDEYDYDGLPAKRKNQKRVGGVPENKLSEKTNVVKRIMTQQERCMFCFENPTRPRHLIVSIANFTYLMLPQWQPVVQGHCCILPMQHESATRNVDNNVWDEIRNFKKCLLMMFAKQEMDVVFLETVMGLAQQRRHCLVECIPLPREIAKEAPLYFKKAIDEAEDEWSQHNAKKLIDTSVKGLRGSIPKDFPYFHVEFGLNKGFVHVIDDERQFNSSLGLNVIRGMLRLPEEDMHRRRKHDSVEVQKEAVSRFAREWQPFDWTRQLE